ncbi:transcriptional regulator [Myxococcota bacterium]|jgi:predicted transcriptional regulator of viral defense system|nr:transcriptional regulator [Myxococcota bacterium]
MKRAQGQRPGPQDGLIRAGLLSASTGSQATASRLTRRGTLVRVERGLYQGADAEISVHNSLAVVSAKAPKSVITLLSALHFHKLGLERPWQAWIALPRGSWAPRLTSQTLRISWLDEAELAQDVEHHSIDGVPVQVFSPARAVVETFHFFRQVGLEPALDALKDYLSRGPNGVQPLMAIARRRRAYNKMRPYVEALL